MKNIDNANIICDGSCRNTEWDLINVEYQKFNCIGDTPSSRTDYEACADIVINGQETLQLDMICKTEYTCHDITICTDNILNLDCQGSNSCNPFNLCSATLQSNKTNIIEPTTAQPTQDPTTDEPTTSEPTDNPITAKPTQEPTTAQPTTFEPTTKVPTTAIPTENPIFAEPTTIMPTMNPTTAIPTENPTTANPTSPTGTPTTAEPSAATMSPTAQPTEQPIEDDKDGPKDPNTGFRSIGKWCMIMVVVVMVVV